MTAIPVTKVELSFNEGTTNGGGWLQLVATISPSSATNQNLIWSNTDQSVAIVSSSGLVYGRSIGTTTVTVTTQDGGFTDTCLITISSAEPRKKIRSKVLKRFEDNSTSFSTIADSDTIETVQYMADDTDEGVNVILHGSAVSSHTMFELVKDLIHNDLVLADAKDAADEVISEGVFDISRSSLTQTEELRLQALIESHNRGWTYFADGQEIDYTQTVIDELETEMALLLKRKYWCTFLISAPATLPGNVEIGPGKIKIFEEDQDVDSIYFIRNEFETDGIFAVDAISIDGYYRRDLVEIVFRDDENTTPYLRYVQGEQSLTLSPKHSLLDKQLTNTFGSYPLWSILFKRTGATTALVRTPDRIFEWAGIRSLVLFEQSKPYRRTNGMYAVNSNNDVSLKNVNGQLLTPEYGESATYGDVHDGPAQDFAAYADFSFSQIPIDLDAINDDEAAAFIFPVRLVDRYNEYVSYTSVEFREFTMSFDTDYKDEALGEGAEAHICTMERFADTNGASVIEVSAHVFAVGNTRSVLTISMPLIDLVQTTFDGDNFTSTPSGPAAGATTGDVLVITSGKGQGQIATVLAYSISLTAPYTVTVKALSSPPENGSQITIFKASTEIQIGSELSTVLAGITDQDEIDDYNDRYKYSINTGESIIPFSDPQSWQYALQLQLENAAADGPDSPLRVFTDIEAGVNPNPGKVVFPFKINLEFNQWYFIKTCVKRKTGAQPQYGTTVGMALANTTDSALASKYPFYSSTYYRNAGSYPGVENGTIFFKIYDRIETSPGVFVWVDIEDSNNTYTTIRQNTERAPGITLPPYWKPVAKNLDEAITIGDLRPPARTSPSDPAVVYIDVLTGKFLFNPLEEPIIEDDGTTLRVTYAINNTVTGRIDSESILHIVDPGEGTERTITLRAYLDELEYRIVAAAIPEPPSRVLSFRGAYSLLELEAAGQYRLIEDPVPSSINQYFCQVDGTMLTRAMMEQQFPVSRKAVYNLTGALHYEVKLGISENLADKCPFTLPIDLNSNTHKWSRFKCKTVGSGYTNLRVKIHNSTSAITLVDQLIPIGDLVADEWCYIEEVVATFTLGETYHYHVYIDGIVDPGPGNYPELYTNTAHSMEEGCYQFYFTPTAGLFPSADVINLLDSLGVDIIAARAPGDDIVDGGVFPDEDGTLDVMSANFTDDGDWLAWENGDYFGIDALTGKIKFPASYVAPINYGEFNAKLYLTEINDKFIPSYEASTESLYDKIRTIPRIFIEHADTPNTYAGSSLYNVRVNAAMDGLEFHNTSLLDLADTPANYTNAAGKTVKVNAAGTGVEFGDLINTQVGNSYTLAAADIGATIIFTSNSLITLTVPLFASIAIPIGARIELVQAGIGAVTFIGEGAVVINSKGGNRSTNGQWVGVSLIKTNTNTWGLFGDLTA